jgi:hypothetical protein
VPASSCQSYIAISLEPTELLHELKLLDFDSSTTKRIAKLCGGLGTRSIV